MSLNTPSSGDNPALSQYRVHRAVARASPRLIISGGLGCRPGRRLPLGWNDRNNGLGCFLIDVVAVTRPAATTVRIGGRCGVLRRGGHVHQRWRRRWRRGGDLLGRHGPGNRSWGWGACCCRQTCSQHETRHQPLTRSRFNHWMAPSWELVPIGCSR